MYTTIIHPIRKALNLSIVEYMILDAITRMSNNQKNGNWCVASMAGLSKIFDISTASTKRAIKALSEKGFIETNGRLRRPTQSIQELWAFPNVNLITKTEAETMVYGAVSDNVGQKEPGVKKNLKVGQNDPRVGQNDPINGIKMTHNTNSNTNLNTNKDNSSKAAVTLFCDSFNIFHKEKKGIEFLWDSGRAKWFGALKNSEKALKKVALKKDGIEPDADILNAMYQKILTSLPDWVIAKDLTPMRVYQMIPVTIANIVHSNKESEIDEELNRLLYGD